MASRDWPAAIGSLILLQQQIREHDQEGVWSHELPKLAASEEEIRGAETKLGLPLDQLYRAFLASANGWRGAYQWVDLFGTDELQGERFDAARRHLEKLEGSGVIDSAGSMLPIAMTRPSFSAADPDVFALVTRGERPGEVLWLANEEVDRFGSFSDFFDALVELNGRELSDLREERGSG